MQDAVLDFLDAELDVFVHGGGDAGNRFAAGRLVVIIGVVPDRFAEFLVVKLHVEIEAGDNTAVADFSKRVEVAGQREIDAGVTAERSNCPEMSRTAKSTSQGILQEFNGRLGPAIILIETELLAVSPIHDAVFLV